MRSYAHLARWPSERPESEVLLTIVGPPALGLLRADADIGLSAPNVRGQSEAELGSRRTPWQRLPSVTAAPSDSWSSTYSGHQSSQIGRSQGQLSNGTADVASTSGRCDRPSVRRSTAQLSTRPDLIQSNAVQLRRLPLARKSGRLGSNETAQRQVDRRSRGAQKTAVVENHRSTRAGAAE